MTPAVAAAALLLAAAPVANAEFTITFNWGAGMEDRYKTYFTEAANVWQSYIFGYKEGVTLTGITLDASIVPIDGASGTLGQAGPGALDSQQGTVYAVTGNMEFDLADVDNMIAKGTFGKVVEHEMGHTLGLGSLWVRNGLATPANGQYTGANALAAWKDEFGQVNDTFVPLEMGGGGGTAGSHWNEVDNGAGKTGIVSKYTGKDMADELMTGWASSDMFTSTLTLGSLVDLGYVIGLPTDENGDYKVTKGPYFGKMTGARKMIKTTGDVARILGDNDFTAGAFITAGKIEIGNDHALGRGTVIVQNGATVDTGTFNLTGITTLTLENGTLTGTSGSITATQFNLMAGDVRVTLAGTGTLNKTGNDVVVLYNANTFSGGTNITGGTLIVASRTALSTGLVAVNSSATLQSVTDVTTGKLVVNGGDVVAPAGAITASEVELISGNVSAPLAGAGTVLKTGTGTATLSGANTYTGGTTVNEGTLRVTASTALGAGAVTINDGALDLGATLLTGLTTVTLRDGAILATTGTLSANRVDLYKGVVTAGISGNTQVNKLDSDDVILKGAGNFTGGLIVRDGRLIAEGANSLGAGAVTTLGSGTVIIKHADAAALATVDISGGSITFDGSLTAGSIGTLVGNAGLNLVNANNEAFALTLGKNNTNATYAGSFSGTGSFTKAGTGTLTLSAASSHSGGTSVTGGSLVIGNANALGTGPVAVNGGKLDLGNNQVMVGGVLTANGGDIVGGDTGTIHATAFDIQAGTISANLTGAGALTKTGTGLALINKPSSYTGGTSVNAGTLKVTNALALGTGDIVVDGGTLTTEASLSGLGRLTVKNGVINGFVGSIKANTYDLQNGEVRIKLIGAATLEKNTGGTVLLTAANSLTGTVQVNASTLAIANAFALGKGATVVNTGATLQVGDDNAFTADWSGQDVNLDGGTLDFKLTSTTTVTRTISGTGGVTLSGSGAITLLNATYSGATVVKAGKLILEPTAIPQGTVSVDTGGTIEIRTAGAPLEVTKDISGTGTVRFSGGDILLRNALTHTGELAIASGSHLKLGESGAPVALNNTLLRIEQGARLSGAGAVAGTLLNAGTLTPGFSPGTLTLAGDFTNAATGTLVMEVAANGAHDQIRYAGTANLNGTLQVAYLGTPAQGATLSFLVDTDTADGLPSVTGQFSRVITPDGRGVAFATATGVNFIVGGTIFDLPGASSPQGGRLAGFANALANAGAANTANGIAINAVTSTFTNSGAALVNTVTTASPLGLASATALPLSQTLGDNDRLYRHLTARRFERGSGWLLDYSPYAYVNSASASADTGKDGQTFDHDSVGGSVGVDTEAASDLSVGAKVGYDAGNAKFHRGGGKLTQNRLHVTAYASQLYDNRYFMDAGAFGGYSLYDVKQNTVLGKNTGDTNGWDAGLFVTGGCVAPLSSRTSLTPHAGLTLSHAQVDAFTQKGNALALDVNGYAQTSLASRVGAGLNHITKVGDLKIRLTLDSSWVHEWLDNEVDIDGSVAGTGFSTSAVAIVKDRMEVGPEINVGVSETGSVSISYKYDYAFGDATAHRFDIGYRTRF